MPEKCHAILRYVKFVKSFATAFRKIDLRCNIDAWGNILSATSTVPELARNRYRFQCREWSAATGLVNFRARWYAPVTGRWLSATLLNDLKNSIGMRVMPKEGLRAPSLHGLAKCRVYKANGRHNADLAAAIAMMPESDFGDCEKGLPSAKLNASLKG